MRAWRPISVGGWHLFAPAAVRGRVVIVAPWQWTKHTPFWLLGFARSDQVRHLGQPLGEFAGVPVCAERHGPVAALICEAPIPIFRGVRSKSLTFGWIGADGTPGVQGAARVRPIQNALTSIVPFVPVRPGTALRSAIEARRLCKERGQEILEAIEQHADLLQGTLSFRLDVTSLKKMTLSEDMVGQLAAQTDAEQQLVDLVRQQALDGRLAAIRARCNRLLADYTREALQLNSSGTSWSVLLTRQDRAQLIQGIEELTRNVDGEIVFDAFASPVDYHEFNIACADPGAIDEARAALGLAEKTSRKSIQMAYRRTCERLGIQSGSLTADNSAADRLLSYYHLLDLIALGQIRASQGGPEMPISLTGQILRRTWLMEFVAKRSQFDAAQRFMTAASGEESASKCATNSRIATSETNIIAR